MKKKSEFKTYLPFTINTFQKIISYKANVIIFMLGELIMLAVTYYLWKAIFNSSANKIINGFSFKEMIIYIFISFLTSIFIASEVGGDIGKEVKDGTIAINLIRPINYEKRMLFENMGNVFYNFVVIGILGFILTTVLYFKFFNKINIFNIVLYFVSVTLGMLLNFYFSYSFGLLSFKITNMWGLNQIVSAIAQLLSGALIPITFFPRWSQVLFNFLPFSSAIYAPTMIYLGKLSPSEIIKVMIIQVIWVVIEVIIAKLLWKKLIKDLTILGG